MTTGALSCGRSNATIAKRSSRGFAGLEGSNLSVTTDERVFVYTWIHIDRPPVGVDGPNDDLNVRDLEGVPNERLVTRGYATGSGNLVKAIGLSTGRS